jgi:hypothetical protein
MKYYITLIKKQINAIINNVEAEDIYSCKQIKPEANLCAPEG